MSDELVHLYPSSEDENHSVVTVTDRSQLAARILGDIKEQRPPPLEKYSIALNLNENNHHLLLEAQENSVEELGLAVSTKIVDVNSSLQNNSSYFSDSDKSSVLSEKSRKRKLNICISELDHVDDAIEIPILIPPSFLPMSPEGVRQQEAIQDGKASSPQEKQHLSPSRVAPTISPLMARIAKGLQTGRGREFIDISEFMEGHQMAEHAPQKENELVPTDKQLMLLSSNNNTTEAATKLTVMEQLAIIDKQPVRPYSPKRRRLSSHDIGSPDEEKKPSLVQSPINQSNKLIGGRRGRPNAATAENAKQSQMRKEFLQSNATKRAFVYESNVEEVQEKVSQMIEDNKLLILKAKQEADMLMRSPLNQQGALLLNKSHAVRASTHSDGISNEMKISIVREALSIRADLRSTMSTKSIVEFLQSQCPALGIHMKLASWDDLVSISNGSSLIEVRKVDPNQIKEEKLTQERNKASARLIDEGKTSEMNSILGVHKGQLIGNLYVVLQGSITVQWQEEDNEAKLKLLFQSRKGASERDEDELSEEDDEEDEEGGIEEDEKGSKNNDPSKLPSFLRRKSKNENNGHGDSRNSTSSALLPRREEENQEELRTLPPDNDQSTAVTTIATIETPKAIKDKTNNPWRASKRPVKIVKSRIGNQRPHYARAKSDRSHLMQDSSSKGSDSQLKSTASNIQPTVAGLITRREVFTNGGVIGENVFRGEYMYSYDIVHYSPDAFVCQIPVIAFEHFVGRSGKDVEEYLVHFWKRLRLWILIKEYNKALVQQNLYEIKFKQFMVSQGGGNRRDNNNKIQVMNVIDSGRIRTYHAGDVIFEQGTPRHYIYIIKQGMAKYYREFKPKPISAVNEEESDEMSWLKDIVPPRVETTVFYNALDDALKKKCFPSAVISSRPSSSGYGVSRDGRKKQIEVDESKSWDEPRVNQGAEDHGGGVLLTHDFSFLDSEISEEFLPHMVEMDKKFLGNLGKDEELDEDNELLLSPTEARAKKLKKHLDELYQESERAQAYRRQKYVRFGKHRNTLIATTRCEICVIHLSEIVKCYPLFQTLFKLANDRYPGLLVTDEDVVRNYHYQQEWLQKKPELLKEIAGEQLSNQLYEEIHNEIGGYQSKSLYDSRKPGFRHLRVQGKMASAYQCQLGLQQGQAEKSQLLEVAKSTAESSHGDQGHSKKENFRSGSPNRPVTPSVDGGGIDSATGSPLSIKFSSPAKSIGSTPMLRPKSASAVDRKSGGRDSYSVRDNDSVAVSTVSSKGEEREDNLVIEFGYKMILNDAIRMYGGRKRGKFRDNNGQQSVASTSTRGSVWIDNAIGKTHDSFHHTSLSTGSEDLSRHHGRTNSISSYHSTSSTINTRHTKELGNNVSSPHRSLVRIHEEEKKPLKIDPRWIEYAAKQHEARIAANQAANHLPFAADSTGATSASDVAADKKKKKKPLQLKFTNEVPHQLKELLEMDFNASPSVPEVSRSNTEYKVTPSATSSVPNKQNPKSSRPFSANSSTGKRQILSDVAPVPCNSDTFGVGPPVKVSKETGHTPHQPLQLRPSSANASIRGTSRRTFWKQQTNQPQAAVADTDTARTDRSPSPPASQIRPLSAVSSRPSSAVGRYGQPPVSNKLRPEDYADLYRAHMGGQIGHGGEIHHHDLSADLAALRSQDREKVNQIRVRHESLLIQQEQYDLKKLAAEQRAEEDDDDGSEEDIAEVGEETMPEETGTVASKRSERSSLSRGSRVSLSSRASVVHNHGSINATADQDSQASTLTSQRSGGSKGSGRRSSTRVPETTSARSSIVHRNNTNANKSSSLTSSKIPPSSDSVNLNMKSSQAPRYLDEFFKKFKA
jgi:hypothetical protein